MEISGSYGVEVVQVVISVSERISESMILSIMEERISNADLQ